MKILKPGKDVLKPRKFVCSYCGCEFIAEKNEYDSVFYNNDFFYKCDCPNCGDMIYYSEEVKEDEQA